MARSGVMNLRFTRVCLHDFGYQLPPVELSSAANE